MNKMGESHCIEQSIAVHEIVAMLMKETCIDDLNLTQAR